MYEAKHVSTLQKQFTGFLSCKAYGNVYFDEFDRYSIIRIEVFFIQIFSENLAGVSQNTKRTFFSTAKDKSFVKKILGFSCIERSVKKLE